MNAGELMMIQLALNLYLLINSQSNADIQGQNMALKVHILKSGLMSCLTFGPQLAFISLKVLGQTGQLPQVSISSH